LSGGPFFAVLAFLGPLASSNLNNRALQKLRGVGWLISTMLLEFNRLGALVKE
jgi:hypothetical protein